MNVESNKGYVNEHDNQLAVFLAITFRILLYFIETSISSLKILSNNDITTHSITKYFFDYSQNNFLRRLNQILVAYSFLRNKKLEKLNKGTDIEAILFMNFYYRKKLGNTKKHMIISCY